MEDGVQSTTSITVMTTQQGTTNNNKVLGGIEAGGFETRRGNTAGSALVPSLEIARTSTSGEHRVGSD